jgi:hypothetical protein
MIAFRVIPSGYSAGRISCADEIGYNFKKYIFWEIDLFNEIYCTKNTGCSAH